MRTSACLFWMALAGAGVYLDWWGPIGILLMMIVILLADIRIKLEKRAE